MRVIVCGSRRWADPFRVSLAIHERIQALPPGTTVVHGDAQGADNMAASAAMLAGLAVEPHPADWKKHGKRAGLIRNQTMAVLGADLCIAFWDGRSTGTAHMLDEARKRGIPVEIITAATRASAGPA